MARKKKEQLEEVVTDKVSDVVDEISTNDVTVDTEKKEEQVVNKAVFETKEMKESLFLCLSESGAQMLGEKAKESDIWAEAIVLVKKIDMSMNYALAVYDYGRIKILKDFGHVSQIISIESVHPYTFLNERYIPNFKTIKDMSEYIISYKGNDSRAEVESMDKETLVRTFVGDAVNRYLYDRSFREYEN